MLTLIPQRTSIRFLCARLRAFCCSSPHLAARCPAFLLLSPEFDHSTIPIHRRADFVAVVFAPSAIVPPETFCIWSLSLSSCQPCPDLVVRGSSLAYFCQSHQFRPSLFAVRHGQARYHRHPGGAHAPRRRWGGSVLFILMDIK